MGAKHSKTSIGDTGTSLRSSVGRELIEDIIERRTSVGLKLDDLSEIGWGASSESKTSLPRRRSTMVGPKRRRTARELSLRNIEIGSPILPILYRKLVNWPVYIGRFAINQPDCVANHQSHQMKHLLLKKFYLKIYVLLLAKRLIKGAILSYHVKRKN